MYLFPEWSMSMARIPPPSPGSAENSNTYLPEERSHTFTTCGEKMTTLSPTFCSCTKQKGGKKCDLASLITNKAFHSCLEAKYGPSTMVALTAPSQAVTIWLKHLEYCTATTGCLWLCTMLDLIPGWVSSLSTASCSVPTASECWTGLKWKAGDEGGRERWKQSSQYCHTCSGCKSRLTSLVNHAWCVLYLQLHWRPCVHWQWLCRGNAGPEHPTP